MARRDANGRENIPPNSESVNVLFYSHIKTYSPPIRSENIEIQVLVAAMSAQGSGEVRRESVPGNPVSPSPVAAVTKKPRRRSPTGLDEYHGSIR
jgi:hypothetical protein